MPDPIATNLAEGDTFKVTFFQRLFGQRIMNVLHYSCTTAPVVPITVWQAMQELAAWITDTVSVYTDIKNLQSNSVTHIKLRVQYLKEIDRTYPFLEVPLNETGARSASCNLSNVAMSIEKRAVCDPAHPREGIGRFQLAGVPDNTLASGNFSSTYIDDANALATDMLNECTVGLTGTLSPCLSHKGGTNWLDNPLFATIVHDTVRDMRQRTVAVGE